MELRSRERALHSTRFHQVTIKIQYLSHSSVLQSLIIYHARLSIDSFVRDVVALVCQLAGKCPHTTSHCRHQPYPKTMYITPSNNMLPSMNMAIYRLLWAVIFSSFLQTVTKPRLKVWCNLIDCRVSFVFYIFCL